MEYTSYHSAELISHLVTCNFRFYNPLGAKATSWIIITDMLRSVLFNYLNSRHQNIQFTKEVENDNSLPFLDIKIHEIHESFISTSVDHILVPAYMCEAVRSCTIQHSYNDNLSDHYAVTTDMDLTVPAFTT